MTGPAPLERGTTIAGRYRLDAPIAAGGMATVWRAIDTVLTRPVAVKVLHAHLAADPDFVARFRREAVAAARLAHPSIVSIYDTAADPESIVMELVEGRTLRDELDARGFLPPAEAVAVASGICEALDVAHRAGIVHRDVKPANVLLTADGRIKVADFGIAKAAGDAATDDDGLPDLTAVGHMVGTAKYLAPEQVSGGEVDARSDVYAVGVVLYEAVCGRPPFTGDNDLAVATARLQGPPPRPRSVLRTVPGRLDEIIVRALASDPDDRYPSASAMWADLQSCPMEDVPVAPAPVDATTVTAVPTTAATAARAYAREERSWLVPAAVVVVVALALGLAGVLIGGSDARRELLDLVDRVAPVGVRPAASPLPISAAGAFDPAGDGTERDAQVPLVIDGDTASVWSTERYDSRAFGGLKDGVGLVLDLGSVAEVTRVRIDSPSSGWAATVHVAAEPGADRAAWGEPTSTVTGASAGATDVEVGGRSGRYVLVWFTDLGDDAGVVLSIGEITVEGR